jgi:hypothetical protein
MYQMDPMAGGVSPRLQGFTTTWSRDWCNKYAQLCDTGDLVVKDTSKSDGMFVCSATELPSTGQHYFEVVFSGCNTSTEYQAFGVWAGTFSELPSGLAISQESTKGGRPFWGLRGDSDKDALRVKGRGKGKVGRNVQGKAISDDERIGMLVDMDSSTLMFFREDKLISGGKVSGFPTDGVRLAACCDIGTVTLLCRNATAAHHDALATAQRDE